MWIFALFLKNISDIKLKIMDYHGQKNIMSTWALETCDKHLFLFSDILWTITWENNHQIDL